MNNQKATNSLLIVLILLLLGVGGYYLYQQSNAPTNAIVEPAQDNENNSSEVNSDDTEDKEDIADDVEDEEVENSEDLEGHENVWTQYEDPVRGFSLSYPEDIFDAEPQDNSVLLISEDHSVPSDFSGENPDKKHNLSIRLTVEDESLKMAIANRDLQALESIPFNEGDRHGKLYILGIEGINTQYGFLYLDENRTMIIEFNYYNKDVFSNSNPEDFTMKQQIEIFYSVLDTLNIQ